MSEDLIAEERARNLAEYVIVSSGSIHKSLHIPAPDSTRTAPVPVCATSYGKDLDATWIAKDPETFPPGFAPVCRQCRQVLTEIHGQETTEKEKTDS